MEPNIQSTPTPPSQSDRHQQSVAEYPELNLSEGEYVLQRIDRHPIGKLGIWLTMGLLSAIVLAGLIFYAVDYGNLVDRASQLPPVGVVVIPAIILLVLFAGAAWVANTVYDGNRIYLTNESLIQHVQASLFSTRVEQLNLVKIEDVTVAQDGILPKMLSYGTVEINTMDSNDSHILTLVRKPQLAANAIHNAAEQSVSRNPYANNPSTGPATA